MQRELWTKDVKYDLLSLSYDKRRFFRLNFLIKAAFEDMAFIRGRHLEGGI